MCKQKITSRVTFCDGEVWENDLGFRTRLDFAVNRAIWMFLHWKVLGIAFCVGLISAGIILHFGMPTNKADLFSGIASFSGSIVVAIIGLVVTVYWNIDAMFGRKWTTLFDKYYEGQNLGDELDRDFHFCNLCNDIITLGLWADKAFDDLVYTHTIKAIKLNSDHDELVEVFTKGGMKKEEARTHLGNLARSINVRMQKAGTNGYGNSPSSSRPEQIPTKY